MLLPTVSQPVFLVSSPHLEIRPEFCYCQIVAGLLMRGALSTERTSLSFTTAVDPRQRSHSRVRVLRDSLPYFTVSDSRLPQPGWSGPGIYIPQEKGDPVIPRGTDFPFRRLLRLEGYDGGIRNRLHARMSRNSSWSSLHSLGMDSTEKALFTISVLLRCLCRSGNQLSYEVYRVVP
jgi:hypothetical protein